MGKALELDEIGFSRIFHGQINLDFSGLNAVLPRWTGFDTF